ncbi:beta-galactosidase [Agaribacterium haliotis]|uniref:beta-galactosidase n=1 Tax=Agaribacterium haliotis TaxID=2013869 RepID=UPI000BB5589F|nr:beta-galactosidase [Agaribacterium haliotis]
MSLLSLYKRSAFAVFALTGLNFTPAHAEQPAFAEYFSKPIVEIEDFNGAELPTTIELDRSQVSLVDKGDDRRLRVDFDADNNQGAGIVFRPQTPWDWSQYDEFAIALDARSLSERSVHVFFTIHDKNGAMHSRSVSIKPGPMTSYYSELKAADFINPEGTADVANELNQASGLRGNPPKWTSAATPFIWMWGTKNLDFSAIASINFHLQDGHGAKSIEIDKLRLIALPPEAEDPGYLSNIVDEFGQNYRADFASKVRSLEDLHAKRDQELKALDNGKAMADRSKFGGWLNGPKLKGTGYFRTQKVGERWALVDPEGYLYLATGIDSARLGDTGTITGYDFNSKYKYSKSDKGTKRSAKAEKHRFVASQMRKDMFYWLPEYGDELSNHYSYIPGGLHSGALKQGESFNFYSANLERKYGETKKESYLDDWEKVTVDRMLNWGFTSLGNWTDPRFFDNKRIPFFTHVWTTDRRYKTVSSGNDFWWALPDPFDPVYEDVVEDKVKEIAKQVKNNPWCVGVFVDNEKSFGRPETVESRYGIVIHTLGRNADYVPTKKAFTELMQEKYQDINKLNAAWETNIASWQAFAKGINDSDLNEQQLADYSAMLYLYGDEYFKTVNKVMKKYLPNHLYLGARFADWGMPIEIVKASAKHVDVVSFNLYKEGLQTKKWAFLEELDMPTIIGEFHVGSISNGHFHPGLVHAMDQQERAEMYKDYMNTIFDSPYFVGAHWFQYIDSPITGRAFDGENYNVGFVSVTDTPYPTLVEAAKELHSDMYQRTFGDAIKSLEKNK